jgi:zinc transport system substrate-binding protein
MDPHFWLDPLRMQRACDIVVDALRTFDPEGSPAYRARAEEVKRSLAQLDEEARGRSARWRGKRIVTAHGSLFYFSARYGPEVVAVVEPLAGREPSPRYVARILSRIKETGAVAVFAENQLDRGPAQAIATESGLGLHELDTVGGLSSTDSYEALFRQILDVFDRTLVG